MRLLNFCKIALIVSCCAVLSACIQSSPIAVFDGIQTSKIIIEKNTKGQSGILPMQLVEAMKTCWVERDELFEGFKINQQGNTIVLNGPIIGNPPQRFLIVVSELAPSGYTIDMEYPKGSNYQFIRSRLRKDLRKLEAGLKPCH